MGGKSFWGLPDPEAIRIIRTQPDWSFGMPSGHVSGTVTFWVGLSLLFKPAAIKVAAALMIVLMPLSRMYLGRHFVADVLGGFLLGALFVAATHALFVKAGTRHRLLRLVRLRPAASLRQIAVLVSLIGVPIILPALTSAVEAEDAGRLLGLNVAFLVLAWTGLPDDRASWPRRLGRILVAFALYAGSAWIVGLWLDAEMAAAIPAFLALWGGVRLGLVLKLYSFSES